MRVKSKFYCFYKITVVLFIFMILSTSCSDNMPTISKLADFTFKQYTDGKIEIGKVIYNANISDYSSDKSDIYDIYMSDINFYKTVMIDENTVLIQKTVYFHSVSGYIVTYDNSELPTELTVPPALEYDADKIHISKRNGYDNIYIYDAGM